VLYEQDLTVKPRSNDGTSMFWSAKEPPHTRKSESHPVCNLPQPIDRAGLAFKTDTPRVGHH